MQQPIQRLDAYRSNITSQHGENGILDYLLSVFTITPTCLEVGASDGVTNSNTFPVWFLHQWQALLIEGSPEVFQALLARTSTLPETTCVRAYITPTGSNSLDEITARVGFPDRIGIFSIDIDGDDYAIFASLHRLQPEIVIIECNPYIPPSISYRDREGHPLLRHSALAIAELGTVKGYRVVACTGTNVILVAEEVIKQNPGAVPDLPLEGLYDHAYADKFSRWVIRAKPYTFRPIYKAKPPPMVRLFYWMRFVWLTLRAALRGKPASFGRISADDRAHLARSGLNA
jgi:hypothetical protein